MTKDEALRLALEALELISIEFVCNGAHHAKKDRHEWLDPCPIVDRYKNTYTAIKAALEAKDEPVAKAIAEQAYESGYSTGFMDGAIKAQEAKDQPVIDKSAAKRIATQLGWEPPRKPLTEMSIVNAADQFDWDKDCAVRFARAIEAAHGIKEAS